MSQMDDLINLITVKNAITASDDLEQKIRRCYEIERKIDSLQEELDEIYDQLDNFEYPEYSEEYLQSESFELEESIEKLKKELDELGGAELLQAQYEQQDTELEELLKSIGIDSKYEFEDKKRKYLGSLVSTEYISTIGEDPEDFFKKLIELYGEKELADFTYAGEEMEMLYDSDYEEDYDNSISHYTYRISDFVSGDEDKIIGLVSDTTLREVLLASKLKFMNTNGIGDVAQYIREYVNGASEHGHNDVVFLDEYGDVDIEDILANFSILPISKDKNFYLYLAKYLDEMQLSFETLLDYIDPDMVDQEFGLTLANVINSKQQYGYSDDFSYSSKTSTDRALIEWLEGKEEELSALEKEQKTISEAEALIDQQKEGQDIGEE